jgi:BirA family biotin operon repressor/biotin-[acetyl-CoA-carboxylase] ligase
MRIITLESVSSTNDYIIDNTALLGEQFLTVRAIVQTKGRGRFSRKWISSDGKDLTFSIVFIPPYNDNHNLIPILTGIAITRAIYKYSDVALKIKWPNDILHNGRKICGILAEQIKHSEGVSVVIGIGFNLNSDASDLHAQAVSLSEITGSEHDLKTVFGFILNELEAILSENNQMLTDRLIAEYSGRSDSIGKRVRFSANDHILYGVITGIDPQGYPIISGDDGILHHCKSEIDYGI